MDLKLNGETLFYRGYAVATLIKHNPVPVPASVMDEFLTSMKPRPLDPRHHDPKEYKHRIQK